VLGICFTAWAKGRGTRGFGKQGGGPSTKKQKRGPGRGGTKRQNARLVEKKRADRGKGSSRRNLVRPRKKKKNVSH